ncbi:MAG TPA: hypothetical protein VF635_06405 [Propionibacteriaceae bacterium]|jgi:hypothetical protein
MSTKQLAKTRKLVMGGVAAAAVVLPLAMVSTPAQAATLSGCTVTPLRPVVVGQVGGQPNVRFSTRVTCLKDRIVQILDRRYEADAPAGPANDFLYGSTVHLRTFETPGTIVVSRTQVATSTENSNEEVYHRTSFRVSTINGVSAWTAFENSPERSVAN